MPQIKNLEAQKQALSDIEALLKDINVINVFLIEQKKYGLSTYTISFNTKNPEENECSNGENQLEGTVSEQEIMGAPTIQKTKKSKRGSKTLKYEAPFLCDNNSVIRTHVLRSKEEMVNKVYALSNEYNIFLDDADMNILNMFKEEL